MLKIISSILNSNEREIKRLSAMAERIKGLEPSVAGLPDADLAAKTGEFRLRVANGEPLDRLLPEAFAVVREAAKRTLGMRHFDVQVMGGIVLHEGNIAEMKTGEGKTLAATMPVYLNALEGKGVHVVTVNDYLARRDAEWMGQIYRFLGMRVGVIVHGLDTGQRKQAYSSDITYGTNNEFGFDYLRDNMVLRPDDMVQRDLHYAIVDEVDSILIDEARTPLIISGAGDQSTDLYYQFARIVRNLKPGRDYTFDEKAHTAEPTEEGISRVERMLGVDNLYDHENRDLSHYLVQALKAETLMKRDRDYIVKDGQVIIVDEFTGRLMFGRRYSDGLHQAIEAKEGVRIERETQTLAAITFQNYFRMYRKLAGMTGTAATEADEFRKIYGLDVVVIPTNEPMIRRDYPDVIYKTERAKFRAVVNEIAENHALGRPVLVGTISIEKSELLSSMLSRNGIPHQVLNAKHHEREAEIVAQAGRLGSVTIATNMAGRGTDIILGGNPQFLARQRLRAAGYPESVVLAASENYPPEDPEILKAHAEYLEYLAAAKRETDAEHEKVVALGGLHIVGTERHEARRIDNQLRGRSGRQGDPGSSRFYLSLEDDLMRLFGSDMIAGLMDRLGLTEDDPIEHRMVSNAIERAQKKVEARNFEIRRNVLEYDNVMNRQREVIYAERRKVLAGENLSGMVFDMIGKVIDGWAETYCSERVHPDDWDVEGLLAQAEGLFLPKGSITAEELRLLAAGAIKSRLRSEAENAYRAKEQALGGETMRQLERAVVLRVVDQKWMDHLAAMDDLREGIGLRAYGQKDPLLEYQLEAHEMFEQMIQGIREDVVRLMFKIEVVRPAEPARRAAGPLRPVPGAGAPVTQVRRGKKIGRNDPCPCGSGKKYKKCCGKSA
ncbi:MAG: preprotein translocase subunit SecA [Firmicutes bacterium]|jgi:preprotein translocase subunit SecA|nr:preprotein translocase subunit SecA [Bacillota bacterium]